MNFNEYQKLAKTTAIYDKKHQILYPALGLAGEAGEVANKVKKIIRDGYENNKDYRADIGAEIGDVLWYCAVLASDIGLELSDIAVSNTVKLKDRMNRGVIGGNGDKR
ncbi:nucleoside triphosphate pyrophosphohydrolase family protein [bacterium]|jgi:NTP pyrophosphatase (non-canonical NTP hydrolase)|nr:nucleoside triphosphate pyrophosphohydrolase family protein [bacterium]